jgi:phospholipid/cholesterol/gamma-HCH transport system permease protein
MAPTMRGLKSEAAREWLQAGRSAVSMYGNFFFWLFREPFPRRQIGQQIVRVMLEAFGVTVIGAVVQGLMYAWLAGWYGGKFSVINWSGAVVIYMLLSETTILIAGVIFASKIGTAFTVEIGSMQMSGQLDALRLMAVEPVQYIVIPRVLASIFCFIVLKTFSDGVAIGSTILFARWWFGISVPIFTQHAFEILRHPILTTSFVRCALMAFFVSVTSCGLGFYFTGGAIELGRTTTKSIVINFITLLTVDWIYGMIDTLSGWSVV